MIMGLRDIGASLPPGFRFYPSDEELVCHYLFKKISNEEVLKGTLVDIDLHTCEPWQLPEVAKLNATEWYFFSFRDRKYATGFRTNRATTSGYWKATGKDRTVVEPTTKEVVGMRKTLVFYKNRAPNGIKTGWIMHEFRLETPHLPPKEDWVLCRVFHKSKATEDYNNNNNLSPPYNNYNNAMVEPSPPVNHCPPMTLINPNSQLASLPVTGGYNEHQHPLLNLLLQDREKLMNPLANNVDNSKSDHPQSEIISSKPGNDHHQDQFGFLWDEMNLDDTCSLGDGVVVGADFDDMRFDHIDTNMVLL
ncbi:NAC domain-containing protein 21/22 [Linum perenne]